MPFGNLYAELFPDLENWKIKFFLKNGQKFVLVRLGTS
jgi:hypothetical protein